MKKRKLFTDEFPGRGTVVLNWHHAPEREFHLYAEGMEKSAEALLEKLQLDPHVGLHGYPIKDFEALAPVFLYRQAVELYMKAIIIRGSGMLEEDAVTWMMENKLL